MKKKEIITLKQARREAIKIYRTLDIEKSAADMEEFIELYIEGLRDDGYTVE